MTGEGVELSGWSNYFSEVHKVLEDGERQLGIANCSYCDLFERLELSLSTCSDVLRHIVDQDGLEECISQVRDLVASMKLIYREWENYHSILDSQPNNSYQILSTTSPTGQGRPRFSITKDQLEYLSSLGFKWKEIAALLGVSRMTIYRRRVDYGLVDDPTDEISNEDLTSLIKQIRMDTPYAGVSMTYGSVRARGLKVTRERIRSILRSIDPLNSALRWPAGLTKRRPYSVPGPNSLWHIDSHHKLIRWRLVTHGGIDGYSRLIVFLQCSANNLSATVLELFLDSIKRHMLPSRVRCDQGMENILVAQYMIEKRGAERRSMITGSSTHNQRIERLWRDMHKSVTVLFYKLFYFMEHHALLDPLNEYHLWALHYIFIPRINRALNEFTNSWNNHPLRTAGHKSPQQLFTAGALLLQNSEIAALDCFQTVNEHYGVDPDGPIPPGDELGVSIPVSSLKFSDADMATLKQNVSPLAVSEEYGLDLYEHTLNFITTLTPVH